MVIHTPTLVDYINVVEDAIYEGLYWNTNDNSNKDIKKDQWHHYKEMTCINKKHDLLYCYKTYYTLEGIQVLSIEEYYLSNPRRHILKNILKEFI